MRRSLALLIPAVILAAACTQSPTAATKRPAVRFDGGNYFGSGNVVQPSGGTTEGGGIFIGGGRVTDAGANTTERGDNYYGSGSVVDEGGNTMGSGHVTASGSSDGAIFMGNGGGESAEDGGIFFGGGHATDTAANAALVDSAEATERGGNYHGSGN